MFFNISNHPSTKWEQSQIDAAHALGGEIVDIPFPQVPANATPDDIRRMSEEMCEKVRNMRGEVPPENYAMIMGEFSLTVCLAIDLDYIVRTVVATTDRVVAELPDGGIVHRFKFVQFRDYIWS